MRKSVNYWTLGGFDGEVPVVDAGAQVCALGYDGIELCFGAGELTPETPRETLHELGRQLAETGVTVSSLATGAYWGQSLSSEDDAERSAAVAFTESYIRAARALGTDAVLVVPGAVDVAWDSSRPVTPAKRVWELSAASLRSLLPVADGEGVTLALENVWNRFLTGPFEFAAFIDQFASASVRGYFDVGNAVLLGYPEHWIEILGLRIARVHVKGFRRNNGGGDMSGFTGSLLDADIEWSAVLAALANAGYDGWLTAEMLVSDAGLPDAALAGRVALEMDQVMGTKEKVS